MCDESHNDLLITSVISAHTDGLIRMHGVSEGVISQSVGMPSPKDLLPH